MNRDTGLVKGGGARGRDTGLVEDGSLQDTWQGHEAGRRVSHELKTVKARRVTSGDDVKGLEESND